MNKQKTRDALRMLRAALAEATDTENFDYQRGRQPSKRHADFVLRLKKGIEELENELKGSRRNPRYLVSRDGNEVGIFPGFNALMAINAARKIYGPGKYSSVKTGEAMFLGRGALQAEERFREETAARAARKAAAKRDKIQAPRTQKRKANPLEKSAEHPIEVTRHYRSGGPNYLSPWQRAMAIGQEELFDTGIQMLPRVAERRAALFAARNPGATKRAYESGLKEATAAQLARLVRVGLRVGLTMAEIKKDVDATGRFTAAQIDRAMDQARSAEERLAKRQNPTPDQLLQSGVNIQIFATRNERARAFAESLPNGALKKALLTGLSKTMNALMGDVTIFDMPDYMGTIRHILARQIPNKPKWSAARAQLLGFFDDRESNPSVKAIYQKFNGRASRRSRNVAAPAGTPRDLAQLGRLRTIKTVDGRTWRFPGDRAPFLAADSRGRMHVVGGQYRANPAGEDCGEIDLIEYQTSKPHLGHDNETIYYHHLGEETGERPTLEITPEGELVIHGGAYRIEPEGLVN